MKNVVFFIPAQLENRYHKLGDLAPFGDTTLLQWKISQCKEAVGSNCIYISSSSDVIADIAKKEGVNHIYRIDGNIEVQLRFFAKKINDKTILWTNVTAPFLGRDEYLKMYEVFTDNRCDLLLTVSEKKDYAFFDKKKINFSNSFIERSSINPIDICTNGAYLFNSEFALKQKKFLDTNNIYLYKLDEFTAIEIKNILDYSASKELITMYFREDLREG